MNRKLKISLLLLCLVFTIGFAQAESCDSVRYSNISPDTFACIKNRLIDYGVSVPPGNSGELSGNGVSAHFIWDGKSNLMVQITKKPFFISCETADNDIENFVQECQTAI